ncbi:MAG: hypothetical protein AMXMBFR64_03520 [Myxococcales bacterium]
MEIKVLGTGCAKCKKLEALATEAAAGLDATVTKVERLDDILAHGVAMTPALVVDGEVKSAGRLPKVDEIRAWLQDPQAR